MTLTFLPAEDKPIERIGIVHGGIVHTCPDCWVQWSDKTNICWTCLKPTGVTGPVQWLQEDNVPFDPVRAAQSTI